MKGRLPDKASLFQAGLRFTAAPLSDLTSKLSGDLIFAYFTLSFPGLQIDSQHSDPSSQELRKGPRVLDAGRLGARAEQLQENQGNQIHTQFGISKKTLTCHDTVSCS